MTRDVSPILDRHVQERLGRILKERLEDGRAPSPSTELDALLASLRAADARRDDGRPERR